MRDRPLIIAGLIGFLGVAMLPLWYDVVHDVRPTAPVLARPAAEKNCVAPVGEMRRSHMTLLLAWRNDVVRNGNRAFVAFNGRRYTKSLTGTCLGCHGDRARFCDRCHDYAGVSPGCWSCHASAPAGGPMQMQAGASERGR